jgi:hypothetical protein
MKKLFSSFRKRLSDLNHWLAPKPAAPRVELPLPPSGLCHSATPLVEAAGSVPGSTIDLPLSSVVYLLPSHLQSRLKAGQGAQTIGIPLHDVLPQLAHGDVRITFGQLRQAAPNLFGSDADEDGTLVQLPLAELASRCDPALLNYSRQLQPEPVAKPAFAPTTAHRPVVPPPQPRYRPAPAPAPAAAKTAVDPVRHSGPGNAPTLAPSAARGMAPASDGISNRMIPPPVAPGLAPAVSESAAPADTLLVDLLPLTESWPAALRNEIELLNLGQAKLALPKDQVSAGLKQGRLAFRWEALRSWIRPAIAPEPSAEDGTELELPLQLVAPLFLAKHRGGNKPRARVQLDEAIPEVFEMARQAPAAPEVAKTSVAVAETGADQESPSAPRLHAPQGLNGAATPEQTVNRAVQLKGVAGALVTLPDGLLVASRFPENRDPEKVAAFLPQIISRLGQCIGQLEIGELNTLEFLVGNVPWKVFRSKEVLFVVLGRGGEALPGLELGILAAKLGKR